VLWERFEGPGSGKGVKEDLGSLKGWSRTAIMGVEGEDRGGQRRQREEKGDY